MNYIILIIILLLFYLYYTDCNCGEFFTNINNNENTSWSHKWNQLDFQARKDANCNPIKKEYKNFGNISAWIWTVPHTCEQGLPHTRNKEVIAMPENYNFSNYDKTIEHEKIHLYQRTYPNQWINFYKNDWDYELFSEPPNKIPKNLINKRRSNPDINNEPWCRWKNRWWSIPIYNNNLSLSGARIVWFDEKTNKILHNFPPGWNEFFGHNISQAEHPHEISAVLLSGDLFKKKKVLEHFSPAMKKLLNKWNWDKNPVFPQ